MWVFYYSEIYIGHWGSVNIVPLEKSSVVINSCFGIGKQWLFIGMAFDG